MLSLLNTHTLNKALFFTSLISWKELYVQSNIPWKMEKLEPSMRQATFHIMRLMQHFSIRGLVFLVNAHLLQTQHSTA